MTAGPDGFSSARLAFWTLIQKRAGSRQAIRDALVADGHLITVDAIGRWMRGEADPGLDMTLWASARWDVPLTARTPESVEEQLAGHEGRLAEAEQRILGILQCLVAVPTIAAWLRREAPWLERRLRAEIGGTGQ